METVLMTDDEGVDLFAKAKDLFAKGDHIHALEIIEDLILVHTEAKESCLLHLEQARMFMKLAGTTENTDVSFTYIFGAVECVSDDLQVSRVCAHGLYELAEHIGSVLYYKKCLEVAKHALSFTRPGDAESVAQRTYREQIKEKWKGLESLIKKAELKIAASKTSPLKKREPEVLESKKSPEPVNKERKGLRSYWVGLDVKIKRDFMKVSIEELLSFAEGVHNREGRDALEQILTSAREDRKWTFWMCRTLCSKKCSSAEECKNHLEQKHAADFKPSSEKDRVKRIGKDWARKISVGGWEPLDAVAAVEMIKNPLADVKTFKSNSGWSKEWPLAMDEERGKLLKEIKLLLVSFRDHKILSSSIRNWLIRFPVRHLGKFEVSEQTLDNFHLVETPQIICFLECHELNQILDFLKKIKCERDDGTDLVCRAVDSFLSRTRVKEKIDFDPEFSVLLLDRRLLKSNCAPFDDEGTINIFDPDVHYAEAHARGDDIIFWLVDYSSVDKIFPRPIREHNLDIWVAVLRAVQFTCRTLGTKYAKKVQVLDYEAALTVVENLCMSEDERRTNLQEDQWNRYASLLCDRCEESVPGNSLSTKSLLCAVRDVLERALHPTYDFSDLEDCLNFIRERKSLSDDIVLKSIHFLKSVITHKVLLIDSKILLIDNSRIRLLSNLTRLSVFDNRSYMLVLLKPFLLSKIINMALEAKLDAAKADNSPEKEKKSQAKNKKKNKSIKNGIVNMESQAKSDAAEAEADLLLKDETKSQPMKPKNKNSKRTSTRMSSPLDKTVAHNPSVNLEPEGASPSLKTVEEDSMEPEDTLASERGRLEISSNTDNQEEATKVDHDMQNMPGEDSLSEHLESALGGAAARYNSAFDMMLKALLNIKVLKEDLKHNDQPFHEDLGEQVPCPLQNFFTAFVSEEIKKEGIYSVLLSDLLASLKEVIPMSSDAAEVLVAILEFWHCWKNPERESLVTRLFTLEENERMSCRKCRRRPNYPVQSSYGIVMAADSIRDLKCAYGNIKFVDILNMIRMQCQMLCDIKTGGCGKTNFIHHIISKCPPIFTIVLEWEKSENEKEISETTKALEWEIDISRLYKGLEPNTNYRLVSMVGFGEEDEEHICLAYEKNQWVNLRRESLAGEDVGNWKSVVRFCGERKVRPDILFYEAARSMPNK